jgi:hypothetical protein
MTPSSIKMTGLLSMLALALTFAGGCSRQGEGERCDKAKAGDSDCDAGLVCVAETELLSRGADRCCPEGTNFSDSRCTPKLGSGDDDGGPPSDAGGGADGQGGALASGGTAAEGGADAAGAQGGTGANATGGQAGEGELPSGGTASGAPGEGGTAALAGASGTLGGGGQSIE